MNTKRLSRTRLMLFGVILMSVAGISHANPFNSALHIRLFPSFPHANAIDFHYLANTGVYFSFTTGQYYYPTRHGWRPARVLPRQFILHPRDRHIVRWYGKHRGKHPWRHQHGRHDFKRGWDSRDHHGKSHGWDRRENARRDNRRDFVGDGERRRYSSGEDRRGKGRG